MCWWKFFYLKINSIVYARLAFLAYKAGIVVYVTAEDYQAISFYNYDHTQFHPTLC